MSDSRKDGLEAWGRQLLAEQGRPAPAGSRLCPISGDASFRRYFRFVGAEGSRFASAKGARSAGAEGSFRFAGTAGWVFVDAPPEREDSPSFVKIAAGLRAQGLCCPEVLAADLEQGYMAVSDLGDAQYLAVLQAAPEKSGALIETAMATLVRLRLTQVPGLPAYDRQELEREMLLFDDWYLPRHLGIAPSAQEAAMLAETRSLLIDSALAQPQVFVHRDYHSRNLMVQPDGALGLLDFQDAVTGPLTYDLVSLLKDCYYRLPRAEVEARVDWHRRRAAPEVDPVAYLKWFDLMGVQRHLKCAGIFARLCHRDGKPAYLQDIPLVLDYLQEAAALYPQLAPLGQFLAGLK